MQIIKKLNQWKRKRAIKKICKANNYNCPECIYHEYIFEGLQFRGVKCRMEQKNDV